MANEDAQWWNNELLLMYEASLMTIPGFSWESNWQDRTDPSIMVDPIAASNALQCHSTAFMSGHISNKRCYFKSEKFREQGSDFLAAYLEKSRKAGTRLVIYFNVHAMKPEFGQDYPEWLQIREDGTPKDDQYGCEMTMCVNSGFRDWVRDVCLDLCKYPIDGIFFDGPVLFAECCYCDNCKRLYKERYDADLPPKKPGHPDLRRFARFQAECVAEFYDHANKAIKAVRPDVALYGNSGSREEPYYFAARNNRIIGKAQDVLAAEGGFVYGKLTTQPMWRVGSNAKYYQTQAQGKPTLVFCSPAHGPWRMYYRSEPELRLFLCQAILQGSGVWFASVLWLKDRKVFKTFSADYKFFRDNSRFYLNTKSKARVAVVWGEDSINFYGKPEVLEGDFTQGGQKGGTVGDIGNEFNGFYDALVKNHVPCDVIDEESVRSEDIGKYDLLILPNVACTGQAFDERLREYVKTGGNVLASFETSRCDEDGVRADDLGLADLFGIKMLRCPLKPFPHFYFFRRDDRPDVFADIEPELLPAPRVSAEIALDGAETVSLFSIKFKGWDGSDIVPSEFPAITVNRYGKGKAVYLAGAFGELYWDYKQGDIRVLFRNLCQWLGQRDVQLEDAPTSVEITHRQARDGSFETVSLINYTGGLTRPFESVQSQENLLIRVRTTRDRVRALRLAQDLPAKRAGDWLEFSLPRLDLFETVVMS